MASTSRVWLLVPAVVLIGGLATAVDPVETGVLAQARQSAAPAPVVRDPCASPANKVIAENCKPGNDSSEWDVHGSGDPTIQGFSTDVSVNVGQPATFKVKTHSPKYRIDIYRSGWYGGKGARLITTVRPSAPLPQAQPDCLSDSVTRLLDCGNWNVSASWQVPADAVSGVYIARLVREDDEPATWRSENSQFPPSSKPPAAPHSYGASGLGELRNALKDKRASHIIFIVRDDASKADVVMQTSDIAWATYNRYGGSSTYGSWIQGAAAGRPFRAYKVSYNRPNTNREWTVVNQYFNAEYPMVRWLERNGYDVTYIAGVDAHRTGARLKNHRLFLSVGHDEYWSGQQRKNVEAARDSGVNLAFLSGNEVFWKVRFEPSIDGTKTPDRTIVCYKETHSDMKIDPKRDEWTGTWRDSRWFNPEGAQPENALMGVIFTVNAYRNDPLIVPAKYGKLRFWRNTDVARLKEGEEAVLGDGILGHEWDEDLDNGFRPAGIMHLSETSVDNVQYIQDHGTVYDSGSATHHLVLFRAASGAMVFGAGTVQYTWGLDNFHDNFTGVPAEQANRYGIRVGYDQRGPVKALQQATVNLFADMGVQPRNLQPGLVPAEQSTDRTTPASNIVSSPLNGVVEGTVTLEGTATDVGGVIGAVEISTDDGKTWHPTQGTERWTYEWKVPNELVQTTIRTRAVDDSANLEVPGPGLKVRGRAGITAMDLKAPSPPFWRRWMASAGVALARFTPSTFAQSRGRTQPAAAPAPRDPCAAPTNKIVAENCKPGNDSTEWDINGHGDPSIQGFPTEMSVVPGETINFKIKTPATKYRVDVFRMGYYGGKGARKVATLQPVGTLPQIQPECVHDYATRLYDCGSWAVSATWQVPADSVSGVYIARAVREDPGGTWRQDNSLDPAPKPPAIPHAYGANGLGKLRNPIKEPRASHMVFVVRDDNGKSDIIFQTADETWQAYNRYGLGNSYSGITPAGEGTGQANRAYKVSYNRPITNRETGSVNQFFNAEYPMVRWLERNGYDVSYFTGVDADRRGEELKEHKLFLSIGHDEYWSGNQRKHVEAARDQAGVNLAFMSGNEVFWKTRFENSADGSNTPYRTMAIYKETHTRIAPNGELQPGQKIDPLKDVWTGTWRDASAFNPEGPQPENALTGTIFTVNAYRNDPLVVTGKYAKNRFWRNTSVAQLKPGESVAIAKGILGHEWDEDLDNGFRPAGITHLSETTVDGVQYIQDFGSVYDSGSATHHLTLYRAKSGALVFGAGTVQYTWGLDNFHDNATGVPANRANRYSIRVGIDQTGPSKAMQQATVNLFADMGVQPTNLQNDLVPATASQDKRAPVSKILSPMEGQMVSGTVTITGTATELGGGTLSAVEVSTDGGRTWRRATGLEQWTYQWQVGEGSGRTTILSRAVDDSVNLEVPSKGVTLSYGRSVTP